MRFQYMSDLHLEWWKDNWMGFFTSELRVAANTLILAGDTITCKKVLEVVPEFVKLYKDVVFVPGNHEFYGFGGANMMKKLRRLESEHKGLHVLDNNVIEIDGMKIVGTTLWFRQNQTTLARSRLLMDFGVIPDSMRFIQRANDRALEFLDKEVEPGCVVVTHHMPSEKCITKKYKDAKSNVFFVCDVDDLITERQPACWVFGHTHDSQRFKIDNCDMLCNPMGYVFPGEHIENEMFEKDAVWDSEDPTRLRNKQLVNELPDHEARNNIQS